MITDKALQMNSFSNAKYSTKESTLNPPKSFNKIINLNLLISKNFWDKKIVKKAEEDDTDKEKIKEINNYIQKSMQFYSNIIS